MRRMTRHGAVSPAPPGHRPVPALSGPDPSAWGSSSPTRAARSMRPRRVTSSACSSLPCRPRPSSRPYGLPCRRARPSSPLRPGHAVSPSPPGPFLLPGSPAPRLPGSPAPRLPGSPAPRLPGSPAPRFEPDPVPLPTSRQNGVTFPALRAGPCRPAGLRRTCCLPGSSVATVSPPRLSGPDRVASSAFRPRRCCLPGSPAHRCRLAVLRAGPCRLPGSPGPTESLASTRAHSHLPAPACAPARCTSSS
ncbi:hypothetical protein QF030_001992 [Streptomyces rishiriensis]|uniref:Basic proline-rich protein-like n=1 Tax=Streptomyces rishiriensis TaxID=68264 RepID=A0ABU0NL32_STRRH|nr:hypothetical protein [Streptomyces rishiriensis]